MKKSFAVIIAFVALMFGLSAAPANAATLVVTSCNNNSQYAVWDQGHEYAYLTNPAGSLPTFCIVSSSRRLVFQSDGNLVVYSTPHNGGVAYWNTKTSNRGATQLRFQSDGNIVIYAGSTPLWNVGTYTSGILCGADSWNAFVTTNFVVQSRNTSGCLASRNIASWMLM